MENYPESKFKYKDLIHYPDGSCAVEVKVTVREGDKKASRSIRLAVLDFRNKAITNPNASDISNASMRCLTKCISLFGLAHYIYANEDMPEAAKEERKLKTELFTKFNQAIDSDDPLLMLEVADRMQDEWWLACYNNFKTDKTKNKRNVDRLVSEGRKKIHTAIEDLKANIAEGHEDGMIDALIKDIHSAYHQQRLREFVE